MIVRALTLAAGLLAGTSSLGAQGDRASSMALVNATVIDVRTGQARAGQTLLLDGRRIAEIGPRELVRIPRDARILDLDGKFVAPGLIDTHVHLGFQWGGQPADTLAYLGWILAGGVTTVRDMSTGNLMYKTLVPLRTAIAEGRLIGPRLYISAGARERVLDTLGVRTHVEAIRRYRELGIDGVKIKADGLTIPGSTPAESLIAMIREARTAGMPAYGHSMSASAAGSPYNFTVDAVQAGIASVSHLPMAWFPQRGAWSAPVPVALAGDPQSVRTRQLFMANEWKQIPDAATNSLIDTMVARHVSFEPTLTLYHHLLYPADYDWTQLTRYQTWRRAPVAPENAELRSAEEARWAWGERFVRRFAERGGVVITGTDDSPILPLGPANEMRLLVRAGLTPVQALQAATVNAAAALQMGDRLGAVEAGMIADLLILNANPLQDVANIRTIDAIIADGRLLDATMVRQLLARSGTPR